VVDADGKPFDEYAPGLARVTGGFFDYEANKAEFNYLDHLGTPRLSTDYTGAVVRTEGVLMGPFGDNFTETNTSLDFTGFAGGFWDSENNGEHFGAREYQNTHGSWLSPDPAGMAAVDPSNPQTWNRYAYVMNNPLSYIDPWGLYCTVPDGSGPGSEAGSAPCKGGSGTYMWGAGAGPGTDGGSSGGFNGSGSVGTESIGLSWGDTGATFQSWSDPLAGTAGFYGGLSNTTSSGGGSWWGANNGTNNSILTPRQQKALHCIGQAAAAKGVSIALDVAGSIPGFGNLFSGTVEGIQALNAGYYGTVALANAGNTLLNPSASGAANTAATVGLTVGSLALNGSKVIPVLGTAVSLVSLGYDAIKAVQVYQQCMGPG
ncbi:MAG TPA: RHS repeat-associated core domain-containing protein, partial [Terriglobales bacterium]|nr:RHS repeat-associated core domain-containing protein [Terriglobales bacterium]